MMSDAGFDGFTDAPAPLALGDLETSAQSGDEAPAPADLAGLGSVTGDAPAPAPLDSLGTERIESSGAPAPADEAGLSSVEAIDDAPTPHGGPGDLDARTTSGADDPVVGAVPDPMELSALEALEVG
jgi:hypothetical protein